MSDKTLLRYITRNMEHLQQSIYNIGEGNALRFQHSNDNQRHRTPCHLEICYSEILQVKEALITTRKSVNTVRTKVSIQAEMKVVTIFAARSKARMSPRDLTSGLEW